MSKKQNIMEINGRRYDAHTGTPLDHGHQPPKTKVIAVHHTDASPAVQKPALPSTRQPSHHSPRKAASHADHHRQQRSTTLMRRAVRKPSVSLKRHTKAQSHTGALIENPSAPIIHPPMFDSLDSKRLRRAGHVKRSSLIMHFNPRQATYQSSFKVPVNVIQPAKHSGAAPKKPQNVPRQQAPDIDAIFDRAIQNATSHLEPAPKKARKRHLHLGRRHHAKA